MQKLALASALLLGTSLTTIAAEPTTEQWREVETITQKMTDGFNNKDFKSTIAYLTDEVNWVGPWGVIHGSKEEAVKMVEQNFGKLNAKLADLKTESAVLHDSKTIFLTTSYNLIIPNAPQVNGTWFQVFEQQSGGTWKISNYVAARRTAIVPTAPASN